MRNTLLSILTLPVMIFSYKEALQLIPVKVEGQLLEQFSGQPVDRAYVYVVQGEEETFTDSQGKFKLNTWQKLPVVLTIDHKEYEPQKITIRTVSDKIVIRLKKKSS
jgi:hypothetical protein